MSLKRLIELVRNAPRVYLCGNGGSAANAIHIANDWQMVGVPAFALTADIATLTRIANDQSYNEIFRQQIYTVGRKDDLLVVLSGSGKSPNVVRALKAAKGKGMLTFAVVGAYHSGSSPALRNSHYGLARGKDMQAAEEAQLSIGHAIMKSLQRRKQCAS